MFGARERNPLQVTQSRIARQPTIRTSNQGNESAENRRGRCAKFAPLPAQISVGQRRAASYDASRTSNSILTSSLALTPAFPGGLIPKSVCFMMVSPV
jgi:hypothetical protein